MIRFACPSCSASFTVGDEKAGKKGKCPKCQSQFVIPDAPAGAAAPPSVSAPPAPPPLPGPASDQPVEIQPCPKCSARLSVMPADLGLDIECPTCQTVYKATQAGSSSLKALEPTPSRAEDDEDERPSRRGRSSRRDDDDEDEDDRPVRRSRRDEDDEDDEDRPRRRSSRRDDEEEDEERPSRRGRRDDDEDADERPSRRGRRDDEDEDRPRSRGGSRKKKRRASGVESKRTTAAILAILIGGFGVHKFYLGYSTAGVLQILLSCVGVGGIIGLVEGIIYLTKTDEDFIETYQLNEKQWF